MKMNRRSFMLMFTFLTILGFATFFGIRANSQTADGSRLNLTEITALKEGAPADTGKYTGPQTVQALMEAFDEIYNRNHSKTTVIVSGKVILPGKAGGESSNIFILTRGETDISSEKIDSVADKRHVSQFTTAEIDARYPRAAWLQLLLNSDITIDSFGSYASYLSKRHTLAFLEDNPGLRKVGLLGIPATDNWKTYTAAYINKLADTHAKVRRTSELAERAKQKAEHAKELVERAKQKAERAKAETKRVKAQAERAKAQRENLQNRERLEQIKIEFERTEIQLERLKNQLERAKTLKPSLNKLKRNTKKTPRYPPL